MKNSLIETFRQKSCIENGKINQMWKNEGLIQ